MTNKKGSVSYTFYTSASNQSSTSNANITASYSGYQNKSESIPFTIPGFQNLFDVELDTIQINEELEDQEIIPLKLVTNIINESENPINVNWISYQLLIYEKPIHKMATLKDNKTSNLKIPANKKSPINLDIQFKKSVDTKNFYKFLIYKPEQSNFLNYTLTGTININAAVNKTVSIGFKDNPELVQYNGKDIPINIPQN